MHEKKWGNRSRACPGARPTPALLVALGVAAAASLPASAQAFATDPVPGCGEGEFARWYGGPTSWHLNSAGYSLIDFDRLQAVIQQGVEVWTEPCCTNFEAEYLGTTSHGFRMPPRENVVIFEEDAWPPELSDPSVTLATTTKLAATRCSIQTALMIFNGVRFSFRPPEEELDGGIDLLMIAVHEFGHWLGLSHTDVPGAVMQAKYVNGTRFEGLAEDDIAGVCAIYPGSCEPCASDDECPGESICRDERCALIDCRDTFDCGMGTICVENDCVPGCRAHQECDQGEVCLDGSCAPKGDRCEKHLDCAEGESCVAGHCGTQPASCTICAPCLFGSDCGAYADCALSPDGPICTLPCESDRDCIGNTVCRQAPGGGPWVCLPDLPTGFCPADYRCEMDDPGPELGCSLLGAPCTGGSFGCGGRSDTCYDGLDGPACSCTCRADEECGDGAVCLVDPSTDLPSCFPEEEVVPCGELGCGLNQRCGEDGCEADPCFGISCEESERCEEGSCVSTVDPAPPAGSKRKSSGCQSAGGSKVALPLVTLAAAAALRKGRGAAASD